MFSIYVFMYNTFCIKQLQYIFSRKTFHITSLGGGAKSYFNGLLVRKDDENGKK